MTAPEFSPAQLAVLAEARALGGWEVRANGRIYRPGGLDTPVLDMCCVAREVGLARYWPLGLRLNTLLGLTRDELAQVFDANDDPDHPLRPALLAALGMEAPDA